MSDWFMNKGSGNERPELWGCSKERFRDIDDLVALRVPANQDRLSLFIINYFGVFFKVC